MAIGSQAKQASIAADPTDYGTAASGVGYKYINAGGGLFRLEFTFMNFAVTITDNGANGSGGAKFFDWSADKGGLILAGRSKLSVACTNSTLISTYAAITDLYVGIGTVVAAADGTLSSTEANVALKASQTLASAAGTVYARPVVTPVLATTSTDLYLNFASATDPTTSSGTIVSNGTAEILVFFGDD